MTRLELLKIVVGRAHTNGFQFRRWYSTRLGLPWISSDAALSLLEAQRRYYALLFSHEFAQHFWKAGEDITFAVPAKTFERVMPDGTVAIVQRKGFTRRSARRDAWRYHLREMALAEEPLRYIRKYLHVEEELEDDLPEMPEGEADSSEPADVTPAKKKAPLPAAKKKGRAKPIARPLPTELPAFLKRPVPKD